MRGIDYGLGRTNIDHETGIRYGVITMHAITQAWCDSSEAQYGEPTCPKCGTEIAGDSADVDRPNTDEYDGRGTEYACHACQYAFDGEEAYPDEAFGYTYDDDGYCAESCLDSDVIVTKSEYYTYGPFCSPCVPGAVSLPDDANATYDATSGVKAYCFGHDWFEGGQAPYRVFRVVDDSEVLVAD